jgi:hypothetical protein
MQARHLFWVLLRDQIGPLLRAEGYRGSSQSWRLEHPSGNAALIQVQRSRWTTSDSVQFTINLGSRPRSCGTGSSRGNRSVDRQPSPLPCMPTTARCGVASEPGSGGTGGGPSPPGCGLSRWPPRSSRRSAAGRFPCSVTISPTRRCAGGSMIHSWDGPLTPGVCSTCRCCLPHKVQTDGWTRSSSSSRPGVCMIRVRPGSLSTSRTCASAPWRQQEAALLQRLPTQTRLTPPRDGRPPAG